MPNHTLQAIRQSQPVLAADFAKNTDSCLLGWDLSISIDL
jgi:hypothetical protein